VQRQAYLSELAALGELRAHHRDDPLIALLIEAAVLHTEANLRVLDSAPVRWLGPAPDECGGVPEALRAAYEEHYVPLLRLCVLLSGDRHAAEDTVQDAFVRVAPRIGDAHPHHIAT
jgi:hypothetical protein